MFVRKRKMCVRECPCCVCVCVERERQRERERETKMGGREGGKKECVRGCVYI